MNRTRLAALSLAAALLAPPSARADSDVPSSLSAKSGPVEVGKPFPSFAGWGLDGTMVSLKRLVEKPRGGAQATRAVVVSFFATWCKPCKKNLPPMMRTVAAAGADVKPVLVDFGPEETEKVKAFLADLSVTAPVLLDPYLKVAGRCGVTESLPRTFVLDGKGDVTAIFVHEGSDFEKALAAELAKIQPPAAAAPPSLVKAPEGQKPTAELSAKVELPAKPEAPAATDKDAKAAPVPKPTATPTSSHSKPAAATQAKVDGAK